MSKKLFRINRKVIVFTVVFSALLSLVIFRHNVFCFAVEKYINIKYRIEGGWDFGYDSIRLEKDRMVFANVVLKSQNDRIDFTVDRLELIVKNFSWFRFDIGLNAHSPLVNITKTVDGSGVSLANILNSSLGKVKVDVNQGLCRLIDQEDVTNVYFSLISDEKHRSLGAFYLSSNSNIESNANLMIKPYQWPQEFISEFEMQDVDVRWLSKLWAFFHVNSEKEWTIKKGSLDGRLWLGLTYEGKLNQTTASLSLSDFDATIETDGLAFAATHLDWEFSYPGGKKLPVDVDMWWQNSVLKSKVEGGSLSFSDPQTQLNFGISDILGEVNFSSFKDSDINLKGFLNHNGQSSPVVLNGNPSLVDKDTLDVDMKLFLEPVSNCSTHVNLSISVAEDDQYIVRGKLKDMGIEQVAMFQHIVGFSFPEVKDFNLQNGKITCELSLLFNHGRVDKLLLDNLVADELQVYWASEDVLGFCSNLAGSAQLDFNALPKFRFPSWEINLQSGDLVVGRETDHPVGISDINMQFFMCRDVFEPSWIKATYEGVEIAGDILGYYAEADVKLHVESSVDRLLQFCSDKVAGREAFQDHLVNLNIELKRRLGYWDVVGDVELDVKKDWIDQAKFGCQLSDKIMQNGLNSSLSVLNQSISKGWFKAEGTSCEFVKFINFCSGDEFLLEGIVSLDGTFDSKEIEFDVHTQYVNLFSSFADVRLNCSLDPDVVVASEGKFHYDTALGKWNGYFPLHKASISEKALELKFQETRADLYIDGTEIRFCDISCESEGLELQGEVAFDLAYPKGLVLKIVTNRIMGTVKQGENFLHHLSAFEGASLPFDGRISGSKESLSLVFDSTKEESSLEWESHLKLLHANYELQNNIVLRDLELDVDSNSVDKEVRLSNVRGRFASSHYENGYLINGKNVEIRYDDGIEEVLFDVRLENQVMDLIRLTGTYDGKERKFFFNEEVTHLFGLRPKETTLILNEAFYPEVASCTFEMPLNEMGHYKQLLADFHLIESDGLQENFSFYPMEGVLVGQLQLENALWKLHVKGSELVLDENRSVNFLLDAEKRKEGFFISDCSFGDFHLVGDVVHSGSDYVVENMVVSSSKSVAHFKPGKIDFKAKRAHLPIEQATVDIREVGDIEGVLDVKGDVEIDFGFKTTDRFVTASVMIDSADIANTGMKLTTPRRVNVEYSPERGIFIEDSNFLLRNEDVTFNLAVPTLIILPQEGIMQGYRVVVSASNEAIDYLEKKKKHFNLEEDFLFPKHKSGDTTLLFDFELTKDYFQVGGMLDEGVYHWRGTDYTISGLTFHYDTKHLDVYAQTPWMGQNFGVNFRILPYDEFDTSIEVVQMVNGEVLDQKKPALLVDCHLKGPEGITIQKIEGSAFGLDFHFLPHQKMYDEGALPFLGTIRVDAEKLLPICGPDLKQFIEELQIKKGYELRGELTLLKDNWNASFFEGYLYGKDFDLLGYQFKTFFSSIRMDNHSVYIRDLKIIDDAVAVDIGEMKMGEASDGDWRAQIPNITITDLRPSLLKKRHQTYQRLKPFHIKNMVFQDVVGNLSDVKTFTGKGHMEFVNTFKQGGHNLLDIPIEIISRLGLDMVLLVPIQGEIDYVLRDGKVVFTKLKNSFSESKRSYFYLWNKSESYVDFSGNMHIDIRMKQYVLLKFTELFVLSINGTLDQPRVSLK